ncbi:unnamed protein product [Mytilus coruscus]|uniref:Uncharacterized protein n=1 Tax=Mytilus coruscus TaxID=42192 RepID=A0A6J8DC59_MYTCO|nr:unnamed protein product [Mytilus coruscus]
MDKVPGFAHMKNLNERKWFDKLNRKYKRRYVISEQDKLQEKLFSLNQRDFWKSIGKLGKANERMDTIPWKVMDNDGNMRTDKNFVLERWKTGFQELLNENANQSFMNNGDIDFNQRNVSTFNEPITREEITSAVECAKLRKASGFDEIPAEVINSHLTFVYNL